MTNSLNAKIVTPVLQAHLLVISCTACFSLSKVQVSRLFCSMLTTVSVLWNLSASSWYVRGRGRSPGSEAVEVAGREEGRVVGVALMWVGEEEGVVLTWVSEAVEVARREEEDRIAGVVLTWVSEGVGVVLIWVGVEVVGVVLTWEDKEEGGGPAGSVR